MQSDQVPTPTYVDRLQDKMHSLEGEMRSTRETVGRLNQILESPGNPKAGMVLEVNTLRNEVEHLKGDVLAIEENHQWWLRRLIAAVLAALTIAGGAIVSVIWDLRKGPN